MNSLKAMEVTHFAAGAMVYFEKHKIMDIIARLCAEVSLVRPMDPHQWMGINVLRIADQFYKACLESSYRNIKRDSVLFRLGRPFHYRVMIHGRIGSGRKTHAVALAKRFNLIYIDADLLIYPHLQGNEPLDRELQKAFALGTPAEKSLALGKIVEKRLLQQDTLRNGWVLVNYPRSLADFRQMFETFVVPPNKLVYLKCPEMLAFQRLSGKPNLGCPQDNFRYVSYEMDCFNKNVEEVDEYLHRRHETLYVDAAPCFDDVRISLWTQVSRIPYVIGFKNQ